MIGTDGSSAGTNGAARWLDRRDRVAFVTIASATLLVATVNALSVADDMADAGLPVAAWEPWVWELSSAAFWIIIGLPLVRILRRLRPPQVALPVAIAGVVLLSIPVCGLHMGFLGLSRAAVYAALGEAYRYEWSWAQTLYEWRKDLLSVTIFAVLGFVTDRFTAETPTPAATAPPYRLEVRDGARTRWIAPAEIERVEAAGNYVELYTSAGTVLHRATLATLQSELAPYGFVRIHRSRLVRRDAVATVTTTSSGDFEVALASGASVAGSRRFRSELRA